MNIIFYIPHGNKLSRRNKKKSFRKKKPQTRTLLYGEMEFRMMLLHTRVSNQQANNCWAKISKLMNLNCPSIIKNTFYSKGTSCLKKISKGKPILSESIEEKTRMMFYIQYAITCMKPSQDFSKVKPNYFATLINESNITVDNFVQYSITNGISLSFLQLEMELKELVTKYRNSEIVQPITLPKEICLPIDKQKVLKALGKRKSEDGCIEWETKLSLQFFLKYPRIAQENIAVLESNFKIADDETMLPLESIN